MAKFETLLVPVDFSPHSAAAVDLAAELAAALGARVHLLHAWQLPIAANALEGAEQTERLIDVIREGSSRELDAELGRIPQGVAGETHLVQDSPVEAIARTVREIGAGLVVMGTRGLTGLEHVLLGSVAERAIRTAPCPVVTTTAEHE